MKNIKLSNIYSGIKELYPHLQAKEIDTKDLVFEDRVRLSCFYCGRYKTNWRCPPNLPEMDYKAVFAEFDHVAFVWVDIPCTSDTYANVRSQSSVLLHKALLAMENQLYELGNPLHISFIGGSCKLCKNGCGKERCNNPYEARTPLEATGVNVIKSAAKYGINISFPATDHMMRVGLLLW